MYMGDRARVLPLPLSSLRELPTVDAEYAKLIVGIVSITRLVGDKQAQFGYANIEDMKKSSQEMRNGIQMVGLRSGGLLISLDAPAPVNVHGLFLTPLAYCPSPLPEGGTVIYDGPEILPNEDTAKPEAPSSAAPAEETPALDGLRDHGKE